MKLKGNIVQWLIRLNGVVLVVGCVMMFCNVICMGLVVCSGVLARRRWNMLDLGFVAIIVSLTLSCVVLVGVLVLWTMILWTVMWLAGLSIIVL